jgi:cytosine/adenosine deaminase-related metal-dependent hydrolase
MILHDVVIYGSEKRQHIYIRQGRIEIISNNRTELDHLPDEPRLELDGAVVLPGFINSHDHLDFNLFPPLGNHIYSNYTEWARDIHQQDAAVIKEVQKVPLHLRVQWGLYKNLLNGFTTVINHGEQLVTDNNLVTVFQDCYSLHSPAFEKNWLWKLNNPLRNRKPFVMHIGEGTDRLAQLETQKVAKRNYLHRKMIAVHGVAMGVDEASSYAGLVWCPASNFFLLNKTADIALLKGALPIVFGTDSTLTSSWFSEDHFTLALDSGGVSETELVDMMTKEAAALWDFKDRGIVAEGMKADLIISESNVGVLASSGSEKLLIMHNGEIGMLSERIKWQLPGTFIDNYERVGIRNKEYLVKAGVKKTVKDILAVYPAAEIPFKLY